MSVAGTVEHHPENGSAPWVVTVTSDRGMVVSYAYRTQAQARDRMPALVASWRNAIELSRTV